MNKPRYVTEYCITNLKSATSVLKAIRSHDPACATLHVSPDAYRRIWHDLITTHPADLDWVFQPSPGAYLTFLWEGQIITVKQID